MKTYRIYLHCILIVMLVSLFACKTKPQQLTERDMPQKRPADSGKQRQRDVNPYATGPRGDETEKAGSEGSIPEDAIPEGQEEGALADIYFEYDKYNLSKTSREILEKNAKFLLDNPAISIKIEGHCDERGSGEYNLSLGEKRAFSARNYFETMGIPSSRISWISYGEEKPADPRQNESAWAKNRRAHFLVTSR